VNDSEVHLLPISIQESVNTFYSNLAQKAGKGNFSITAASYPLPSSREFFVFFLFRFFLKEQEWKGKDFEPKHN